MLASFLYASRIYKGILEHYSLGELNGALAFPYNEKEKNAQHSLKQWLSVYPELGELINPIKATTLAGVPIATECLYIPYSGWMDSQALCHYLINNERISVLTNKEVHSLMYGDNQWWVEGQGASILVLANGYKINQFKETDHLPIKPIRGQMTSILSTQESKKLKIPVCAEGHVLPSIEGMHHLGATYELGVSHSEIKNEDNRINLEKLEKLAPHILWSKTVVNSWSGIRASTPDYLPLVGSIAQVDNFLSIYAGLESNAKRWIAQEAPYYPGLYAFAGFGSRGLTTIPLAAEWLAGLINNEFSGATRYLIQALSPARFLRRTISRGLNSRK
jgi:tRNA 5-methylaminomethyl-2-thiouridine biosynthesis bifunctional protein